jgi:hypothetical protein
MGERRNEPRAGCGAASSLAQAAAAAALRPMRRAGAIARLSYRTRGARRMPMARGVEFNEVLCAARAASDRPTTDHPNDL